MSSYGEPRRASSDLDGAAALTLRALQNSRSGYLYETDTLDLVTACNLPSLISNIELSKGFEANLFGDKGAARLLALKHAVIGGAEASTIELDLAPRIGQCTLRLDLERMALNGNAGLLTLITDITEMRHREMVMKTLLRELSHRSKNLLAIIQGIATQTARQALSLDGFLVKFRGRIQSLSNSQDLVTDSSWRGAFLFELAQRQFAAYWPDPENPVVMSGINAHLSPNAALHVGLAFHELIVNSASHGAIALGVNSIALTCRRIEGAEGEEMIELVWTEDIRDLDNKVEPDEHSFGRTVLERVVPSAIAGSALYIATATRTEYRLTIPAREYELIL